MSQLAQWTVDSKKVLVFQLFETVALLDEGVK